MSEQAVKTLPEGVTIKAEKTDDDDILIILFTPDGRQITFRMKRDHAEAIQV